MRNNEMICMKLKAALWLTVTASLLALPLRAQPAPASEKPPAKGRKQVATWIVFDKEKGFDRIA
ncbi:MAG: hypothetical protein PHF00_13920, partial [Elusimicrobia bacterium]|nr:hypothetical protein [Elusimicrobiota bacterium]